MTSISSTSKHLLDSSLTTQINQKTHKISRPHGCLGSIIKRIQRICGIIINILSFGRLCSSYALDEANISVIKNFNERKLNSLQGRVTESQSVKNDTLEGVRDFAREMMGLTIDCLKKKYVTPENIKQFNDTVAEIPQMLKDRAKEVISIGTQSAKPIFEIISHFQVNDQAMEKIDKVLKWALKDIKPEGDDITDFTENFRNELLERLERNEFAFEDTAQENVQEQTQICIKKILKWLFKSNHSKSPYDLFTNADPAPKEELITCILQNSFQILAEKKIDHYKEKSDEILQTSLPELLENTIRKNATNIIDLLSNRLSEVIDNMDNEQFTVLFDKIIEVTGQHVKNIKESYAKAEQVAKEHQALKEYAEDLIKRDPKNDREEFIHKRCNDYLNNLEMKGDIAGVENDIIFRTFLTLTGNAAPCIESNVTTEISRSILEILLPATNGKNGLESLLETIEFPQEFKDLLQEVKEVAEMIITPEQFKELNELSDAAGDFKNLALEGCAEVIKIGLKEAIDVVIRQMSKPEELSLVLTNSILPTATEKMIKFFADDLLIAHVHDFAPFFLKLPDEEEEKKLLNKLFELAKQESPQFKFNIDHEKDFFKVVKPRIEEIVELLTIIKKNDVAAIIKKNDVVAVIMEYYHSNSRFDEQNSNTKSKEDNPHFAHFVDAALQTGEFGPILPHLFKLNVSRSLLNKMMTNSIHSFRQSYRPGLNLAISAAREKYLKEEVIESWLPKQSEESLTSEIQDLELTIRELQDKIRGEANHDKRVVEQERLVKKEQKLKIKKDEKELIIAEKINHENAIKESKNNLRIQIDKVSRLGYDMLLFKAGRKIPLIGKYIFQKIVGPTAEKIIRVISTLFNRILGHHTFNEYLISKIFSAALHGVKMTTTAAQGVKPLLTNEEELIAKLPVRAESSKAYQLVDIDKNVSLPFWKRILIFIVEKFKEFFQKVKPRTIILNNHQRCLMLSLEDKPNEVLTNVLQPLPTKQISSNSEESAPKVRQRSVRKKHPPVFFKEENPNLNSSLKKVSEFVSEFMQKLSQEIFNEKVEPITAFAKNNADNLPEKAHQFLDWTSRIIGALASTILGLVIKRGYKFELDEAAKGFFNTLFKNLRDLNGHIKEEVLHDSEEHLRKVNIHPHLKDEELKHYITPIHDWVTQVNDNKNNIKSLSHFIDTYKNENELENFAYNEDLVSKFYVAAIQWLVKYKIENHVGSLQNFLENDLSRLIKSHLDKNMQHISNLLFNRIGGLINDITDEEYKAFFDQLSGDINDQMENLIKAQKAVSKDMSDNEKEDEEFKRSKIAEELTSEKLQEDKPVYTLHPLAKALLHPPANLKTTDDVEAYKASEENKAFLKIVERMMNLALPISQKEIDGRIQTVDAFKELWDNIFIESEVQVALDDFRDFIQSLLPEKYADKLDLVEVKIKTLVEKFALNFIKQHSTKLLANKLREIAKLISDVNLRKEFLAEHFNVINMQIVKSFITLMINKSSHPEKLFKTMIEGEEDPEIKKKLATDLWNLASKKFKCSWEKLDIKQEDFENDYLPDVFINLNKEILKAFILSPDFKENYIYLKDLMKTPDDQAALAHISGTLMSKVISKHGNWSKNVFKDDRSGTKLEKEIRCFNVYLEPLIKSIVQELIEKQNAIQRKQPEMELQDDDINTVLRHYFEGENDNNVLYANIVTNMIKMGNLGGRLNGWISYFTGKKQKALTEVLLPTLHPIRASLRGVIDLALDGIKSKYLDDKYIKDLINPQTLKILKAQRKKNTKKIEEQEKLKAKLESNNPLVIDYDRKLAELDREKNKIDEGIRAAEAEAAREPERQAEIELKFNEGLENTTNMLYDIFEYLADHATGTSSLNWAAKKALHGIANPQHLFDACKVFYEQFFDNSDLNEALFVNIMEKALTLVEEKIDV